MQSIIEFNTCCLISLSVTSPDLETAEAEDTLDCREIPVSPLGASKDEGRPSVETPVSTQHSDSPIVQEPDDLSEQEDHGANKSDLCIVESSDEQADKKDRVSEYKSFDSFEKVKLF